MNDTSAVPALPDLMTPHDLAARWGCSTGHLANLRSAGAGPVYLKLGSSVRYRVSDLMQYEAAQTVNTASVVHR